MAHIQCCRGKANTSRPQSKQLHFASKCKPSVSYLVYRNDSWNSHGQTFELWNTLNLGDFEEFTFLMKSFKFLGIPKYALLFFKTKLYFYQDQLPGKCLKIERISYIHFVWQSCKLIFEDIDKHIMFKELDNLWCEAQQSLWETLGSNYKGTEEKRVKKSYSYNPCRVVGLGNLMRCKICYLIISIRILKSIQSRSGKLMSW